jgi:hypothetical protein
MRELTPLYTARSPLGVLEGLGNIQPEALSEMGVPERHDLDQSQWTALGLTAGAGLLGGALLAWSVGGKALTGALVGVGGASLSLAVFPPVWVSIERARCEPSAAPVVPPTSQFAEQAARYIRGDTAPAPQIDSSQLFGLGQATPASTPGERPVVLAYTRPSRGVRIVMGLGGVALMGIGILTRGT